MENLTREQVEKIFEEADTDWEGDNAFQGLLILSKYIDHETKDLIQWAGHDIICSVGIDEAIDLNISEEDWIALANLNWMLDEENDSLACFV